MGGGLMQLVAYGSQDVYLTGNPQITFWKVVYRRHTNFALESVEQTFNGTPQASSNVVATISRNGDLIHKCYLVVDLAAETSVGYGDAQTILTAEAAHNLIESVELEIGGQQIDKQYGDWMQIWNELSLSEDKQAGYKDMVTKTSDTDAGKVYIPLQFFFCTNPGLALPLIALQYHEVRIKVKFGSTTFKGATLWVDYVYLDTDERRRMAQSSHEFLITQLQADGGTSLDVKQNGEVNVVPRLNFNHPVKELVWCIDTESLGKTGTRKALSETAGSHKLTLNGHERAAPREGKYFTHVQPYQHHTRVPPTSDTTGNIAVYSFALKPEESQPSGSCNFSRIDNAQLTTTAAQATSPATDADTSTAARTGCTLKIFATNWNVLRVMSGMGGLAYSN